MSIAGKPQELQSASLRPEDAAALIDAVTEIVCGKAVEFVVDAVYAETQLQDEKSPRQEIAA